MKLWNMPCKATQVGRDIVESSDKTWCTVEGNGKPSYQGWHKKLEEMLFDSWFLINPRFPISMDKVAAFKPPHHWGLGKRLPCLICGYSVLKSWVRLDRRIPGQEDSLEKGMAPHSSILAWRIPWAEEPGGSYSPWGRIELANLLLSQPHFLLFMTNWVLGLGSWKMTEGNGMSHNTFSGYWRAFRKISF